MPKEKDILITFSMEINYWFSEQSREDIFEIIEYIAEENPSAAQRFSVQGQTTCALIAGNRTHSSPLATIFSPQFSLLSLPR